MKSKQFICGAVRGLSCSAIIVLLAGGTATYAANLTFSLTQPVPDANDISSFVGAALDRNNIGGDGANDGAANDGSTYVAFDRPHQGQTFTTGSDVSGLVIAAVWLRHVGYTGNSPGNVGNGTYYFLPAGGRFDVRVTNPAAAGTAGFAIASESYITTGMEPNTLPTAFTNTNDGTGTWLRFGLDSLVFVAPNTVYGFDVTGSNVGGGFGVNPFFETSGTSMNAYAGGAAYNGNMNGVPTNVLNPLMGDRAFMVELGSPPAGPTLEINRDTGEMTLLNSGVAPAQVMSYQLTSAAGGLNPANWQSVTGNFDAASNGGDESFDNEVWAINSSTKNDLDEGTTDFFFGDGGTLSPGSPVPIGLANAWTKSIYEDVVGQYMPFGAPGLVPLIVTYTGNGGLPYQRSDLDFNGSVGPEDWPIFIGDHLADLSGMTQAEAYQHGDLNNTMTNDYDDWLLFRADFIAANGAAAWVALTGAAVPEPHTGLLTLLGLSGLACICRRLRS